MRIHFIGIGGASMRNIAALLAARGHQITGSDIALDGHNEKFVEGADLVVYTSAVGSDNVELRHAAALGIPTLERAEMLAKLAATYQKSIAVAGSHGKTTVTGMLAKIFAPLNPTIHIGGTPNQTSTPAFWIDTTHTQNKTTNTTSPPAPYQISNHATYNTYHPPEQTPKNATNNDYQSPEQTPRNATSNAYQSLEQDSQVCYEFGQKVAGVDGLRDSNHIPSHIPFHMASQSFGEEFFITEACEYNRSFLRLSPSAAIILNIDLDHTDCYKDLGAVTRAFSRFASRASEVVFANGDESSCAMLDCRSRLVSFGLKKTCDFCATALSSDQNGCYSFCVFKYGRAFGNFALAVAGLHNVYNALAAIACADYYGLTPAQIANGLQSFVGMQRRFEFLGEAQGVRVFSDYAHHPREIDATLKTARKCCDGKLTVVFEPHTYSRTQSLLNDFAKALAEADEIVLLPIYAARETNPHTISSLDLSAKLADQNKKVHYFATYPQVLTYLLQSISSIDNKPSIPQTAETKKSSPPLQMANKLQPSLPLQMANEAQSLPSSQMANTPQSPPPLQMERKPQSPPPLQMEKRYEFPFGSKNPSKNPTDAIIFMGAGDIDKAARMFIPRVIRQEGGSLT